MRTSSLFPMTLCALAVLASPALASAPDVSAALGAYENVRAALADDDLAAAKTHAGTLAAAKTDAAGDAALKTQLSGLSAAAAKLSKAPDIAAARLAFGDASKALITAVATRPALAEGLHAFVCPMAKGYKKWVEPRTDFRNPYMGKRMLKCGGATKLTP